MKQILIIESQSEAIIAEVQAKGMLLPRQLFIDAINQLAPNQFECTIAVPYVDGFDPAILHDVDAVIITGSSVEWGADDARAAPIQKTVHAALNSALPIFGACNGMQVVAHLLGGKLGSSRAGTELALARDVTLTTAGKTHQMFKGRGGQFTVPCMHREEVVILPEGAVLLASNAHSHIQAFAYEINGVDFWGVQYHPEFTFQHVGKIMKNGVGVFTSEASFADTLIELETVPSCAETIGISENMIPVQQRASELKNWLIHIKTRGMTS